MRITAATITLALTAVSGLAQGKRPLPPAQPQFKVEPSSPKQGFFFSPVRASSTRFPDQLEPDTAASAEETFALHGVTIFVPGARTPDAAWEKAAQSTSEALDRIGLVATSKAEFSRFPSVLALELKSLHLSKRYSLVFRPKDQKVFAELTKGVELLGDRSLGPVSYDLRGCAFLINGQFYFTDKGCQVALAIENRVYGNLIDEGKPAAGPGDLIPAEWMDTRKLTAIVKGAMPH